MPRVLLILTTLLLPMLLMHACTSAESTPAQPQTIRPIPTLTPAELAPIATARTLVGRTGPTPTPATPEAITPTPKPPGGTATTRPLNPNPQPIAQPTKAEPRTEPTSETSPWKLAQPLAVREHTPTPPPKPEPPTPPKTTTPTPSLVQLFPAVRVDRVQRFVEFDGTIPIDAHDPGAPNVYLELIACTRDSREHESLVVTSAKPSHIHAALLLLGLEPGTPERLDPSAPMPATGPTLRIEILFKADNQTTTRRVEELIINAKTGKTLPNQQWVFAGSRFLPKPNNNGTTTEVYDADGTGTLIGLATFGSETIAPRAGFSPQASVAEPVWIARKETLPKIGTPVTVRLHPINADR